MPTTSSSTTSRRLLSLLSLLQTRRDWPGRVLADRLQVTERTVRRDIDRLRELDYAITAIMGPDGGYRLEAGAQLPPLLFDDDQAVALSVALRTAVVTGAGIEEAAARAMITLSQVMPARLRSRIDAVDVTAISATGREAGVQVDTEVLLAIGSAIQVGEELRFDYDSPGRGDDDEHRVRGPRSVQPHHLVVRAGLWYLVGWVTTDADWRVYRVDRIRPRTPNGPRFLPREIPGGVESFLAARFKGSPGPDAWPCIGEVIVHRPFAYVIAFAGDGEVEPVGPDRCRLRLGAWSWAGLAATLARFDADLEVLDPPELRQAFAALADRAQRAAVSSGRRS